MNLIFLNYAHLIYIVHSVVACAMQFSFVRYSSPIWMGSLAINETQVCRMGGIYSSTKEPYRVVLVNSFLTCKEYYSKFLTAKPFFVDFLYLILTRNNKHLCNPLYVVSQLAKLSQILYEGMTCCHKVICTCLDSYIGRQTNTGLYHRWVLFYH